MQVKTVQIYYKLVKVKQEKIIFPLKIIKNFIISLKYLFIKDYQLYAWGKSKPCSYRETRTINNKNRIKC